jgi:hypothetical protein
MVRPPGVELSDEEPRSAKEEGSPFPDEESVLLFDDSEPIGFRGAAGMEVVP